MPATPRVPYALRMALPTPKENTTALVTGASSGIGAEIAVNWLGAATASPWSHGAKTASRRSPTSSRRRTASAPR